MIGKLLKVGYYSVAAVTLVAVFAYASQAEADEDIYPEMFIEDCKYASMEGDPHARIWEWAGALKPEDSEAYQPSCSCLSEKFFSKYEGKDNIDYAYEGYMVFLENNGRVDFQNGALKRSIGRDVKACEGALNPEVVKKIPKEKFMSYDEQGVYYAIENSSKWDKDTDKAMNASKCLVASAKSKAEYPAVFDLTLRFIINAIESGKGVENDVQSELYTKTASRAKEALQKCKALI